MAVIEYIFPLFLLMYASFPAAIDIFHLELLIRKLRFLCAMTRASRNDRISIVSRWDHPLCLSSSLLEPCMAGHGCCFRPRQRQPQPHHCWRHHYQRHSRLRTQLQQPTRRWLRAHTAQLQLRHNRSQDMPQSRGKCTTFSPEKPSCMYSHSPRILQDLSFSSSLPLSPSLSFDIQNVPDLASQLPPTDYLIKLEPIFFAKEHMCNFYI